MSSLHFKNFSLFLQVFILFSLLILLWFFQSPVFMPGWADFFMKVFTLHSFSFSIYDLQVVGDKTKVGREGGK
jgi:hypothetical protein